jgi:hypothetical protein
MATPDGNLNGNGNGNTHQTKYVAVRQKVGVNKRSGHHYNNMGAAICRSEIIY